MRSAVPVTGGPLRNPDSPVAANRGPAGSPGSQCTSQRWPGQHLALLGLWLLPLLATTAGAQSQDHDARSTPQRKYVLNSTGSRLPPSLALRYLVLGNRRHLESHRQAEFPNAHHESTKSGHATSSGHGHNQGHRARTAKAHAQATDHAPRRPAAAGRHVAAVFVDSDLRAEPATLLGTDPAELLVFRSPGPVAGLGMIARLEHAVRNERLTLAILIAPRREPAWLVAARRRSATSSRCTRAHLDQTIPRGHATDPMARANHQVHAILTASDLLRAAERRGTLWLVPATIDSLTGQVAFGGQRAARLLASLPREQHDTGLRLPNYPSPTYPEPKVRRRAKSNSKKHAAKKLATDGTHGTSGNSDHHE